jgi:hypothetical protein
MLMGFFGEMWTMQLKETRGKIENIAEYIEFVENAYISWESRKLPEGEWISKAKKTIFIRKDDCKVARAFRYAEYNITPITSGLLRKRAKHEIGTTLLGRKEFSLLHMVLPRLYIPEDPTFSNQPPEFVKKRFLRIAMTWSFVGKLSIRFRFKKVNQKKFDDYKAVGNLRIIKVDSEILREAKKKGGEFTKDILAKMAVESAKRLQQPPNP